MRITPFFVWPENYSLMSEQPSKISETKEPQQDNSSDNHSLTQENECEVLYKNSKNNIETFINNAACLPNQNHVIAFLRSHYDGNDEKKMVDKYINVLLFKELQFDLIPYLYDFFLEIAFTEMVNETIAEIFKQNVPNKDSQKLMIIEFFLYDQRCKPTFCLPKKYEYKISKKVFSEYIHNKGILKIFPFYEVNGEPDKIRTKSIISEMWERISRKNPKITTEILSNIRSDKYTYLNPGNEAPFKEGPVALLFAGGLQASKTQFYADETNCCLMAHHLYEMGYDQENIMCFVEGGIFDTLNFPPFSPGQIYISADTLFCSYKSFKDFGFKVFEGILNNSFIFSYSIIKAVIEAKGPVLIYFSNHGNNSFLFFPYSDVESGSQLSINEEPKELEAKVSSLAFIELCDIIETYQKHVLFILDCCESEEFTAFSEQKRYNFIHFITSSQNKDDVPGITKSVSYYTMTFKKDGNELNLSSQFTRFFLDSIHDIQPTTKINEFVDIINSKGNIGFKAKLKSNNPRRISIFLQAPRYKYINYTELYDNYREREISYSSGSQTTYIIVNEDGTFEPSDGHINNLRAYRMETKSDEDNLTVQRIKRVVVPM